MSETVFDWSSKLPPFSGDKPKCIKCGNEGARTRYIGNGCGPMLQPGLEFLQRECWRCDYTWEEAVAPT